MDCRTFHENHVAFVDDLLAGVEAAPMERHLRECAACADHDARVRRSLVLLKSLPSITPSADFGARLEARLEALGPLEGGSHHASGSYGALFAVTAGVAAAAYLVLSFVVVAPSEPLRLPPVVASRPALPAAPVASPAIVASVPMGMPVWSAVMLAEEAPMHFTGADLPSVEAVSLER